MKRWATEEQQVFLEEQVPQHLQYSLTKKVHLFWPILFSAWFLKFPESDVELDIDPSTGKPEPTIHVMSWISYQEYVR